MTRVIDVSPDVKRMDIAFWGMQRQREFSNAVMNAFEGRRYAPKIEDDERAKEIAAEAVAAVKEIAKWCESGDEMAFFGQVLFSLLGMVTVNRLRAESVESDKKEQEEKFEQVELKVVEEDGKTRISRV